jgi:hypothetical protein
MKRAADDPALWSQMHAGIPPVYDIRDHAVVVSDIYRRAMAGRTQRKADGKVTASKEAVRA